MNIKNLQVVSELLKKQLQPSYNRLQPKTAYNRFLACNVLK